MKRTTRTSCHAGWMASAPAVYLGEISYSIYMVCVPWKLLAVTLAARVTDAPDKQLQIFVWLAVVALIPVVAAVSYHLVEHPARRGLRALAARRRSRSTPAPVAVEG